MRLLFPELVCKTNVLGQANFAKSRGHTLVYSII